MEIYLFKSAACWAILYGFYALFLERDSMHTAKRWYLLAAVVLGAVIPLIEFTVYVHNEPETAAYIIQNSNTEAAAAAAQSFSWSQLLWGIYWLGVAILSLRFLWNLGKLILRIQLHPTANEKTIFYVLLGRPVQPHTFLKYIFVNRKRYSESAIPKEVLLHEQAHARQLHSADVLLVELLQILFWFNPLIYLFKHSIKLNHEFLADRAVLRSGIPKSDYQNTLLAYLNPKTSPELASAINYSSIKKRFTLMKNSSSKTTQWLKSLLLLPLLAILFYSFSSSKEVVIDPENAVFSKSELENTNHPSYADLNNWQNAKDFALYLDGRPIDNGLILEFHPNDLPFYKELKVDGSTKKAVVIMSNSFWQDKIGIGFVSPEQQEEIIEEALQDKKTLDILVKGKTVMVNGVKTNLRGFKAAVDNATRNWEEQDYTNASLELRIKNADYAFMRKLNDAYKQTNFYKANPSEYGLNPPPPPPPPPPKADNIIIDKIKTPPAPDEVDVIIEEVIEEDGVKKRIVKRKAILEETEDEEEVELEVIELKEVIESDEQDEIIEEEIEVVSETPPPPPPPKSPIEFMQEMVDKGAKFILNGKTISAAKAMELVKNDTVKTIDVEKTEGSGYTVLMEQ